MICGLFSANEWLYPDTDIKNTKKHMVLTAAKNSFACVQVLILQAESEINLSWHSEQHEFICPEVFRLHPVCVDKNTGKKSFTLPAGEVGDHYTRKAPFWVYDAMEPIALETIKGEETVALYLRWPTQDLEGENFIGELRVNDVCLSINLKVYPAIVPSKETLRLTNWFKVENMATYHGAEMWSDKHWEIIKQYALLMRHARQTDFWLLPRIADVKQTDDGDFIFDFSRTEKFIRLFLSLGFSYIESSTPIHRLSWEKNDFVVFIDGEHHSALSDKAYKYMQGYFTGLYNLLERNGWLSITIQHVGDEPTEGCANEYRILSDMIRKWMPGIPIIEAVETPNLDGAVDIWVPKNNQLTNEWDVYNQKKINGDSLWFYTCCVPGGKYLNRLLDEELLRTRYLHWANCLYGLPGYLHWGLNNYGSATHPFNACSGKVSHPDSKALPCGDTHIVYPGEDGPWGSVRLEMMRAGCEDYELLVKLQSVDPEKANMIMAKCVRSFTDYTTQVEEFEKAYECLLDAVSKC